MFHVSSQVSSRISKRNLFRVFRGLRRFSTRALMSTNKLFSSQYRSSSCRSAIQGIENSEAKEVICDFGMFDDPKTEIDSIIILNNELNYNLLSRSIARSNNIVLADGGANHFYALEEFRESEKIRAVVGDFDCIKP